MFQRNVDSNRKKLSTDFVDKSGIAQFPRIADISAIGMQWGKLPREGV